MTLVLVVGLLIGLNAASYVKVEKTRDSELTPDRSTFNAGPTGTRALYDFLHESGYPVMRWRESPDTLLDVAGSKPATLIIVGETVAPISNDEAATLLRWVRRGGRLVIIDRTPDRRLLPAAGQWTVSSHVSQYPFDVDPNDFEQMTAGVKTISPIQPTPLSREVNSILPSRFATSLQVSVTPKSSAKPKPSPPRKGLFGQRHEDQESEEPTASDSPLESDEDEETPPPPPRRSGGGYGPVDDSAVPSISTAPVVHFAGEGGALLVDYPQGKGRLVVLADPYIVANNGLSRADNLQLAINIVGSNGGLIAFDEFHQGHATTHNALIQYFAGTPVVAISLQLGLLALLIIWSRGRRFARALPLPHVDRRSSLEFVASMAELQQRARAYDLALENIYGRVRRVLVRQAGVGNNSPRTEIAKRVASRSHVPPGELESLMRNCEDVINGAPTSSRRSLDLARRLRRIEAALGLRMRAREEKQATGMKTDL